VGIGNGSWEKNKKDLIFQLFLKDRDAKRCVREINIFKNSFLLSHIYPSAAAAISRKCFKCASRFFSANSGSHEACSSMLAALHPSSVALAAR
jgi:hypothetical protein